MIKAVLLTAIILAQPVLAAKERLRCTNADATAKATMPTGCESDFRLWDLSLFYTFYQGEMRSYIDYTYREDISSAPKRDSRWVTKAADIPNTRWWKTGPYSTGITFLIEVTKPEGGKEYYAQAGLPTLCADGKFRETRFTLQCAIVTP